jgi:hypothetical protein
MGKQQKMQALKKKIDEEVADHALDALAFVEYERQDEAGQKMRCNMKKSKIILVVKMKKISKQVDRLYFMKLNSWSEILHYVHKFGNILRTRDLMYADQMKDDNCSF